MAQADFDRVFREHRRYTGDGLPNAPTGAPLPLGDPASGVHNPSKADLRSLGAAFDVLDTAVQDAQDAQAAAESAAGANLAMQDTRATAALTSMPGAVNYIRTQGYAEIGDGGGALYRRAASEPAHAGKFQSADGAWWELAERVVTPIMLGAAADGTTDDAAVLNACVAAGLGALKVDGLGKTYRVDSTITLRGELIVEDMEIDFSAAAAGDTLFSAEGAQTAESDLTSSVTAGATSVAVADGSIFQVGQWVKLASTRLFTIVNSATHSEMNRIKAISGNTITLTEPVLYTYGTGDGAKLVRLDFVEGITLRRIRATGGGVGGNHFGCFLSVCRRIDVFDCDFDAFDNRAFDLRTCAHFRFHQNRFTRSTVAGLAYGVTIVSGCTWGQITDNFFADMRHGVTIGGNAGINRQIVVAGNNCHGCTDAGIDCHPAGDYIVFANNTTMQAGGQDGIVFQGSNGVIKGNTIRGATRHGILAQLSPNVYACSVTIADNLILDETGTGAGIFLQNLGAISLRGVAVTGNVMENGWDVGIQVIATDAGMEFVTITGNSIGLVATRGIFVDTIGSLTIKFGVISGNAMRAGSENIFLNANAASAIEYFAVTGNQCFGGTHGLRGVNTNRIAASGNVFAGASSAAASVAGANNAIANNVS